MDRAIRQLERQWEISGSNKDLERLLAALLRYQSIEEWDRIAEHDEFALKYIEHLREFALKQEGFSPDVSEEVFVNVYEDYTARTAVSCHSRDIINIRRFFREYYVANSIFYQGRNVYDLSLQREISDPASKIVIRNSVEPCFRFISEEIREEARRLGIEEFRDFDSDGSNLSTPSRLRLLSPKNLRGNRDYYVSLQLIDAYPDPAAEVEEQEPESKVIGIPHWLNVYETTQNYGGPEEGGWHYYMHYPISAVYVGVLPAEVFSDEESPLTGIRRTEGGYEVIERTTQDGYSVLAPEHLITVVTFLSNYYADMTHGDIHSVLGGAELDLRLETHPAVTYPFYRPHYC